MPVQDGFQYLGHEEYENTVKFSVMTLVEYLMTQSNIIAAVEGGSESITEVQRWLTESVTPFLRVEPKGHFCFVGLFGIYNRPYRPGEAGEPVVRWHGGHVGLRLDLNGCGLAARGALEG